MPWSTTLPDYQCFGCSPNNPHGLQLAFDKVPEGGLTSTFVLDRRHESYPGVVHGGITGLICDEVMGNLVVLQRGVVAFTAALRVVYLAPLTIGERYRCVAYLQSSATEDVIRCSADVLDATGLAVAMATASYRPADIDTARSHIDITTQQADALRSALATSGDDHHVDVH